MTAIQRKIIHIDCDCFFAAVEMRDRPELRTQPLAIGGAADARGVISTCNYLARNFGIHSAMPTSRALRLCPNLVLLPHDMARYRAASQAVQAIFRDYTDRIEPLSLDEAYLDVTGLPFHRGSASLLAQEIRARIEAEVGITASAGIAPNKLLAKIASDWNKPNGQCVVTPQQVAEFILPLPITKLWGVGKVSAALLAQHGIHTCGDAQKWSQEALVQQFGRLGLGLYRQCRGEDDRPVETQWQRKSLSVEHTYPVDLPDLDACLAQVPELFLELCRRIEKLREERPQKLFVKIKFHDFSQTTAELNQATPSEALFAELLQQAWRRGAKAVRLLGLGVRLQPIAPISDSEAINQLSWDF